MVAKLIVNQISRICHENANLDKIAVSKSAHFY